MTENQIIQFLKLNLVEIMHEKVSDVLDLKAMVV